MRAKANEDILAAVLLEREIKGSSGRGTGEVIGTASGPLRKSEGQGTLMRAWASSTGSTTGAEEIVAFKHKAGSGRSQEPAVAAAPRPAPWAGPGESARPTAAIR